MLGQNEEKKTIDDEKKPLFAKNGSTIVPLPTARDFCYKTICLEIKNCTKTGWNIIKLFVPVTLNSCIGYVGKFLPMLFFNRLGDEELAAGALIGTTTSVLSGVTSGFQYSMNPVIAKAYTEEKHDEVVMGLQQGCIQGLIVVTPAVIFGFLSKSILVLCQQPLRQSELTQDFLRLYVMGLPVRMLVNAHVQFAQSMKKQNITVALSIFRAAADTLLTYLFISGVFGLPKLNAKGFGLAYFTQPCLSLALVYSYIAIDKKCSAYNLLKPKNFRKSLQMLKKLFKIGTPIAIQIANEVIGALVVTMFIGTMEEPTQDLAAYNIGNQYRGYISLATFALSKSLATLVGHARGKKDIKEIKRIGYVGTIIGVIFTGVTLVICICLPKQLASLYLDVNDPSNALIVNQTRFILPLAALGQMFAAIREGGTGGLRGLHVVYFPMYMAMFGMWCVSVPVTMALKYTTLGAVGAIIAQKLGAFSTASTIFTKWIQRSSELTHENLEKRESNFLKTGLNWCYKKVSNLTFFQPNHNTQNSKTATNNTQIQKTWCGIM